MARGLIIVALTLLATLALHAYSVFSPMLMYDDFQILDKSLTWSAAWENLWQPQNEHAMPLGRLSTAALTQLGGATTWPLLTALQGPLALLAAMGLLYLFIRRELGHPFYGLVAMILFGVTGVYLQAIAWFAASFVVLVLATILLGVLAAQRWRQRGQGQALVACVVLSVLAPGWFALGILAGPLCCLYLASGGMTASSRRSRWFALAPLVGTATFLAISLPRTAAQIMHLEHYGTKTAVQAFSFQVGAVDTARSLVENLTFGAFGLHNLACPLWLDFLVLALLALALFWWWRPISDRRLLVLGLGLILLNYLLVYSARAEWDYDRDGFNGPVWTRYHLLPQLGLTLLICGGLPAREGRWFALDPRGSLTRRQAWGLAVLIVVLVGTQVHHTAINTPECVWEQREALRDIEATDVRCHSHRIAADTAGQALPPLEVPVSPEGYNGWQLLRGSPEPEPITPEEARNLLRH
jgi:hypothetical protein